MVCPSVGPCVCVEYSPDDRYDVKRHGRPCAECHCPLKIHPKYLEAQEREAVHA